MIMHKSNAHWETGASPSPELIERVRKLISELAQSGALLAGEGLRPTSQGLRIRFVKGERTVIDGPFTESKEVIAGFAILRLKSLQEAIEHGARFARVLAADLEIDVRPVTEPWDIGIGEKPAGLTTRRYMCMHKYLDASDGCRPLSPAQGAEMGKLLQEMTSAGILLTGEGLDGSARGARIRKSSGKLPTVTDGPFTESKEVLGGYIIVKSSSLDEAVAWAQRYFAVVDADEVHVRQVAEGP
jgi:hypothetical protein